MPSGQPHPLVKQPDILRWWIVVVLLSGITGLIFSVLHLPAAMLLASMLVAMGVSTRNVHLRVAPVLFGLAQGVVGCLMARTLQADLLGRVAHDWPLFLSFTMLVLIASAGLGYLLAKRNVLPGTTAIWGLAPGAASAMVIMADAYGADIRLVALMQYLRVVIVTLLASLITSIWMHHVAPAHPVIAWSNWNSSTNIGLTVSLVLAGSVLARIFRISGGALLLPLVTGIVFQHLGWLTIELPPPLLAIAYAVLGWSIGLRFDRNILVHAWSALPHVLIAILTLVLLGLLLAVALYLVGGFDPLSAYLATSPGGADSVAVIAASASVDAGFVMAMQLVRFVIVLLLGPGIFRWIANKAYPTDKR